MGIEEKVGDEKTTGGTTVGGFLDHVGKLGDADDEDSNEDHRGSGEGEGQEETSGSVDEGANDRADCEAEGEGGLAPGTDS